MMPSKITVKRMVTARNRRVCWNRAGLSMTLLERRTPDQIPGPHQSCDGCCSAVPRQTCETGSSVASGEEGEKDCRGRIGAREGYASEAGCKLLCLLYTSPSPRD